MTELEQTKQDRDDALFALQALVEEFNAYIKSTSESKPYPPDITLADCIQGAVDMRQYVSK